MTDLQQQQQQRSFRFAIAATFTADPLRRVVSFWAKQLGAAFETRFAPFNQVLQSLIDPASELGSNTHGVNVVLLRLEDLSHDVHRLEENVRHFADELRGAPGRLHAPLLAALCPSAPGSAHEAVAAQMEVLLDSLLEETPGVQFIPRQSLERLYPVPSIHSPEGDRLGRIPYTEAYYCALGTMLVRHTHALLRQPFKVIALDCDNTLWAGICGEDGPENVVLDPPRKALHEFMLEQREDGMLLTLASKNNEDDALETFRLHPEFPLQPRHFVTWRLNWEAKSDSLASIADQLSLGLDSFIFIDDNPKECAELEDALPQVLTLALPEDIERTPRFLHHVWAFDRPVVTEEDRSRNAFYARTAEFGNEVRRARSMEDFLASLQLRVQVAPMQPAQLPRVAQLTQRTNQFNTTTIRRTEADVQSLIAQEGGEVLTAHVSDRFGDYGLVGVILLRPAAEPSTLVIDNMLLSCRALGRGVEHEMLASVGRLAQERGIARVKLPFTRTAKNTPAFDFVQSLGFPDEGAPAGVVAAVKWTPSHESAATARPVRPAQTPVVGRQVDYGCIASKLSTVPEILEAMRRSVSVDPTMSEAEQTLAAIWADLLDKPTVRREDNFFDLGGHSLLAVLLLMRVHEEFGVELPVDDVYTGGLTLADLAARIETARLGDIDPEQYAALLAEIENLSDDEVRELLAREDGQG